jgi:sulfopyruvate decarboxylase subunit alpha
VKDTVVNEVIRGLKEAGVKFVSFLPDSWFKKIYFRVLEDPDFVTRPVSNEGVGVGLCCGAWLGGMKSVMMMENTGVRMACDQLARLGMSVGLPCFMMIPYRGDIGDGQTYAVAHGKTMLPVLEALQIPYFIVRDESQIRQAIRRCLTTLSVTKYHVALIMGAEVCMDDL